MHALLMNLGPDGTEVGGFLAFGQIGRGTVPRISAVYHFAFSIVLGSG